MLKKESGKRAEKVLAGIQKIAGCTLLNWTEPEYPQSLLQIYDPPVLLYVRGDPQVLNLPSIGIVGTRRPTLYGTQMAQRLGRDLAALSEFSGRVSTFATRRRTRNCTRKCWGAGRSSANFHCARTRRRKISRCVTGSCPACRAAWWSWKALEMKGIIRQLPGKQFSKVLL